MSSAPLPSPAFKPIDLSFIESLTQPHKIPEQVGPVRRYDKEMRCIVTGYFDSQGEWVKTRNACHSPTYFKLQGQPTCSQHVIIFLNKMLVELGVEK